MTSKDAGIGRIILPSDVERESYIRRCYDTGRVSIYGYGVGVVYQAAVPNHIINDIVFPLTVADSTGKLLYGSAVSYIKMPKVEEYVIFGVLKEIADVYGITEDQFSVGRKTKSGIAMISGDADDGALAITVNHNTKNGMLTINVGNKKSKGKMSINVTGAINSMSDEFNIAAIKSVSVTIPKTSDSDVTTIKYVKGVGFSYSDEFGNTEVISKATHRINHKKKIILGDPTYSAVLYEELSSFLSDFITDVSSITTLTLMGSMPVLNAPKLLSYLVRLNEMKMKSSYVKLK